jgi:hypothetical protein
MELLPLPAVFGRALRGFELIGMPVVRFHLVYNRFMQLPNDYNGFKAQGLKLFGQFKRAWNNREIGWLLSFFIVVLFAIISAIGLFTNGLTSMGLIRENIFAPKKELGYRQKSQVANDDGSYTTVYILAFAIPPNHLGEQLLFYSPNGCDEKKLVPTENRGTSFKNGTTYATSEYEITCKTERPIQDNYELFTLKK